MIYDLQKASLWKRAAAFMLDAVLIVIVATGVLTFLSWAVGYNNYLDTFTNRMQAIEEEYGLFEAGVLKEGMHMVDLTEQDLQAMTEEQKEMLKAADEAFGKDPEAAGAYNMMTSLLVLFVSIPLLVGYLVIEFVVPLILKNGQTLGKKVFGIAVVRVDCVRITPLQLLVRTLLGKYTIETMVPALLLLMIIGTLGQSGDALIFILVLVAIAILEVVVMIVSKTNSLIHDLLAGTVAVDMASQMIFDTPEALLEYKKKLQAEIVADSQYP